MGLQSDVQYNCYSLFIKLITCILFIVFFIINFNFNFYTDALIPFSTVTGDFFA